MGSYKLYTVQKHLQFQFKQVNCLLDQKTKVLKRILQNAESLQHLIYNVQSSTKNFQKCEEMKIVTYTQEKNTVNKNNMLSISECRVNLKRIIHTKKMETLDLKTTTSKLEVGLIEFVQSKSEREERLKKNDHNTRNL